MDVFHTTWHVLLSWPEMWDSHIIIHSFHGAFRIDYRSLWCRDLEYLKYYKIVRFPTKYSYTNLHHALCGPQRCACIIKLHLTCDIYRSYIESTMRSVFSLCFWSKIDWVSCIKSIVQFIFLPFLRLLCKYYGCQEIDEIQTFNLLRSTHPTIAYFSHALLHPK